MLCILANFVFIFIDTGDLLDIRFLMFTWLICQYMNKCCFRNLLCMVTGSTASCFYEPSEVNSSSEICKH